MTLTSIRNRRFNSLPGMPGWAKNDLITLKNNEYKIVYFTAISAASGTITIPQGATILLDQFPNGVDAYVSQVDANGQPTGLLPKTGLGVDVVVTSFDALGNYTLSGTPSSFPVALIYVFKIKGIDYSNINLNNELERVDIGVTPINRGGTNSDAALVNNRIIQSSSGRMVEAPAITANRALVSDATGIPVASSVTNVQLRDNIVYTWNNSTDYTENQYFEFTSLFGDRRIYKVLSGQTLNAGETPHTNPEKVILVNNNWLDCEMVQRWHVSVTRHNFTKVLSFDNGAVNPLSSATPIIGNGQAITELTCRIQTGQPAATIGRMSLYRIDSKVNGNNHAFTAQLIHDGGTFLTDSQGAKTVTIPSTVLYKGELYVVVITNSNSGGSWQRMSFDLSFLGFQVDTATITRYVHFVAQTSVGTAITDPSVAAQSSIRIAPSGTLPVAFIR